MDSHWATLDDDLTMLFRLVSCVAPKVCQVHTRNDNDWAQSISCETVRHFEKASHACNFSFSCGIPDITVFPAT